MVCMMRVLLAGEVEVACCELRRRVAGEARTAESHVLHLWKETPPHTMPHSPRQPPAAHARTAHVKQFEGSKAERYAATAGAQLVLAGRVLSPES